MVYVKADYSRGSCRIKFESSIGHFILLLLSSTFVLNLTMAQASNELQAQLQAVLQGNGAFTKNLYQVLAKKPGNVFFSPISVHAVLAMIAQGSDGITKQALTKTLNVADVKTIAAGYSEILRRLNSVNDVTLLMANKVFLKDGYELQQSFEQVVTKSFHSEVQLIEFTKNVEAAKAINSWVEGKTNDKIKDLISKDDLNNDTRLVLVNAIYFKGKWLHPFDAKDTYAEKFYLNADDSVDVEMMHITKKFGFKNDENLDAKILELPYTNKALSMIIILPNQRDGITELESKLAGVDLTKITDNMYNPEVRVTLPKFKIEQTIDLKDSLSELGLENIFGDHADFSGLIKSAEGLKVSKAVQKAFIEVNEEGSEAAAATAIGITLMCMPAPPQQFTADHPFLFSLNYKQEGTSNVLFKGKIHEPKFE